MVILLMCLLMCFSSYTTNGDDVLNIDTFGEYGGIIIEEEIDLSKLPEDPMENLQKGFDKFIISQGSEREELGQRLLEDASIYRDGTTIVKKLLDCNVDPNRISKHYSPLHWACEFNCGPTVKLLLDYNADVNIRSSESFNSGTPLHVAAQNIFLGVDILLEKFPDLDAQDCPRNETPLHKAVSAPFCNHDLMKTEFIKKLLYAGADPYLRRKEYNVQKKIYEPAENVYELAEKGLGIGTCNKIKKYRGDLRFSLFRLLSKPDKAGNCMFNKDIAQLIANFVYPNNPEKKS